MLLWKSLRRVSPPESRESTTAEWIRGHIRGGYVRRQMRYPNGLRACRRSPATGSRPEMREIGPDFLNYPPFPQHQIKKKQQYRNNNPPNKGRDIGQH